MRYCVSACLCGIFLLISGHLPAAAQAFAHASTRAEAPAAAEATAPPAAIVELRVAAAADLQPVMPALAALYLKHSGVRLLASFGSSATLEQQLLNGAPEDIFLSADLGHAQAIFSAGAAQKRPVPYARGVLVLWARSDSPAQPLDGAFGASLRKASVVRIAIANPTHAPYGAAAIAALRSLDLYSVLASRLVTAENVSQSAQFAATGNAQAAFISLTIANSAPFRAAGSFVRVPTVYPELRQSAVVLKRSDRVAAAEQFLSWLLSPEVQAQLPALGLDSVR